jgi:hypothetical protein
MCSLGTVNHHIIALWQLAVWQRAGLVSVWSWDRSLETLNFMLFHAAATLSFYIVLTNNFLTKVRIFRRYFSIRYFMIQCYVALVSTPPHRFFRQTCWYYQL